MNATNKAFEIVSIGGPVIRHTNWRYVESPVSFGDVVEGCPHCKGWTDVGPEFSDDSASQRWNCGVCGEGPTDWLPDSDSASAAWNAWAKEAAK